jgi:cyclic-di-AMP phosphodiesterase PgpH
VQTIKVGAIFQRLGAWARNRARVLLRLPGASKALGALKIVPPPLLIFFCMGAAVVLLFPFANTVQTFDLPQVGDVAKETVIAPFTFDILKSPEELDGERHIAADKVLFVLDYDTYRTAQVRRGLTELKRDLLWLGSRRTGDSASKAIHRDLARKLSENAIKALAKRPYLLDKVMTQCDVMLEKGISPLLIVTSRERLRELQEQYNATFANALIYDKQYITLRKDSVESTVDVTLVPVREIAFDKVIGLCRQDRQFDADALNTIYELLSAYVQPNCAVSSGETLKRREKAARDVLVTKGKVIKDTEIIRKHQEITPAILEKLKSLRAAIDILQNVQERKKAWAGYAGRLLLALLALVFAAFFLAKYHPALVHNTRHGIALVLVCTIQLMAIRCCLFLFPKFFEGASDVPFLVPEYFVPTTIGATLAAILFGQGVSFIVTLFTALFFGIVLGFNEYLFLFTLLGGMVSGLAARNIRYRWEYFKIIPPVLVIYLLCIALWQLIGFKLTLLSLVQNTGLAAVNVGVSLFLAMTLTPLFERLYDITTDMTLIELSDMNHPVLKRLSIEAAGTYNHSVLVGNLAESAAEAIGANPLLARVASYYHDIGKIEKADYYVENAASLDKNRHNKLAPSMSALIILSHVKSGLELARAYRLPKVIQEIIVQHHGTSAVSFFYEKALERDPHKQVRERDFRYVGPPPQTRETAIIMLADSVEAASRSLRTSSPKLLRELVKKIIRDKLMDGQLDQCTLTLRDLDGIVTGFMPVLQAMFHFRVAYPAK